MAELHSLIDSGRARDLRLTAGYTLDAAGRECQVTPGAILRWERGERRPQGRNVAAYHRWLQRLAARQEVAAG